MSKPTFKISAETSNNKAIIRIDGSISNWSNSAVEFKSKLDSIIKDGIKDVDVYINSGGGSCFEANEISNELLRFQGAKKAYLGALCASAATYIATKIGYVIASKNTSYMIHKPMMSVDGNSSQIEAQLKALKNIQEDYINSYSTKTGLTVAKIETMWVEDFWMNAEEAKKLGFIDEIEGDLSALTEDDILALKASGYKNIPNLTATVQPKNEHMKQLLITALALSATISDTELVAHIDGLKAKAAKADDLEKQLNALTLKGAEDKADAVIEAALIAKKITASNKDFYKKSLMGNFDDTKKVLDDMPAVVSLSANLSKTSDTDKSNWTYEDYQNKDIKALEELAANDEAHFQKLFDAHYAKK